MTDLLEEKFKNHVKITNQCLEFAKGEPEATMTETNLAMIELGDLKQKMTILRTVVEKLKLQTKQAETIAQYMHERIETCEFVGENLPKRIGTKAANPEVDQVDQPANKTVGASGTSKPKESKKGDEKPKIAPTASVPKLRYLTLPEFEDIPKYMKGRWSYDGFNCAVDEFNNALNKRYTFLAKGFQAMASVANKKRFKEMKSQESRDTRGIYFLVADDLKKCDQLKTESARRNVFAILRHFQLIREIRGPGSIIRFAVNQG